MHAPETVGGRETMAEYSIGAFRRTETGEAGEVPFKDTSGHD